MATLALRNRPLGAPLQGPGAVVGARDGAAQAGGAALLQVDAVSLEYHTPGRVVRATHRVGFDVFASERFVPVSYTHLDVYKRQSWACPRRTAARCSTSCSR